MEIQANAARPTIAAPAITLGEGAQAVATHAGPQPVDAEQAEDRNEDPAEHHAGDDHGARAGQPPAHADQGEGDDGDEGPEQREIGQQGDPAAGHGDEQRQAPTCALRRVPENLHLAIGGRRARPDTSIPAPLAAAEQAHLDAALVLPRLEHGLAGGRRAAHDRPSVRSNCEPWHAQVTTRPSTSPSLSGQPRCEQRSWIAWMASA